MTINTGPRKFTGSFFKPEPKPKKTPQPLSRQSKQAKTRDKASGESSLAEWFPEVRSKMTGMCHCGCGQPSQKNSDQYYKFSACHIYPKARFESVATHPLNFVEMAFFGGCHSNMDDRSVEKWPGMECWSEIKAKVAAMDSFLTDKEKGKKFYLKLQDLISKN